MNAASVAKYSTSLQGQMPPSLKAAIDYASQANVTGLAPTQQRIVDKALANSNMGRLSTATLTKAIDGYLAKSDIVSLGARHPSVADLTAGQTFAGGTSAMQKAFEEANSASTLTGSMPIFSQAMIDTGLGSKLAEVTRIAPRHQKFIGFGEVSDSALSPSGPAGTFPYPPMALSPEIYRLAAEGFPSSRAFNFLRDHKDLAKIRGVLPGVLGSIPDFRASMMPTAGSGALGTALLAGYDRHRVADHWKWSGGSALVGLGLSSKAMMALGLKYGTSPSVLELTAAGLLSPTTPRDKGLGPLSAGFIEPVASPSSPTPELQPAPTRRLPARGDHEVAPVAASYFAGEDRRMVIALLDTAELDVELEHLEALEERVRTGHVPARNHAAVSARLLLQGVANHCFPARKRTRRCRLGCPHCPHELTSREVKNRLLAFVDERLSGSVDTHEYRIFIANIDYVYRWGGRGTHETLSRTQTVKAFVRLLEVLAMVARAYGIQPSA